MYKMKLFAVFIISLFAQIASAQDVPRIAFIYHTPEDTIGWSFEHDRARKDVESYFGDQIEVSYFWDIAEGEEGEAKMKELAADGYDLIFATSYGYLSGALNAAFAFPDVKIEHSNGYVRAPNSSIYSIRTYEGRVPQGILAGYMTKTNKVGYIASFAIPYVFRDINAAFLAARSVNPDVEFEVVWLNTWENHELEAQAARDLIANGADVLMQNTNTIEPMKVAQELGAFAFGQDSDMRDYGPDAQLTASINHWSPYYIRRIQALLDGTWESTDTWEGIATDMLEIGVFSDLVPLRIQEQAADAVARIRAGRLHPFTGPIRRQDGSGWLAAGETASDSDLLTMGFFVEGMFGSKQVDFDVLLNLIHGRDGEDGKVASLMDFYGLPYISPRLEASAMSYNKLYTKFLAESLGIKAVAYEHLAKNGERKINMEYPVIIKPVRLGSSIGVSIVKSEAELDYALDVAFEFDTDVIVEPFIEGVKEYNQAGCYTHDWELSIVEEPQKEEFLDFDKKYMDFSRDSQVLSADIAEELKERIQSTFQKIYDPLFRGSIIRCDFFVVNDEILLNEINPIPGSMANYLFPDFEGMLERLSRVLPKERTISVDYTYIHSIQSAKGKA